MDNTPLVKLPQRLAEPQEMQPPTLSAPLATMPDLGAPTPMAHVMVAPKQPTPLEQQIQGDNQSLQKIHWQQSHPWGTDPTYDANGAVTDLGNHPGKLGKVAHIFSQIGNIAGNIFAPATMQLIPGTQMNRNAQEGQLAHRLNAEQQEESAIQHTGAETARTTQQTASQPDKDATDAAYKKAQTENLESETSVRNEPDLARAYAHAVNQAVLKGQDPAQDPIVQHLSDAITSIQKQSTPAAKNTKEQLQAALVDAQNKGDAPGAAKLTKQLKDIDPLGQSRLQVTIQGQQNANNRAESNVSRQDVRAHDKAYVQPAESVEKSYNMMDHAYNEFKDAKAKGQDLPTGAQSMLALSTHLATTFGNVKGARVTKDMIAEHLGARSIGDDALVAVQKLTNGDRLSPAQWDAFHDLIKQSRNLSWQSSAKEAARKHIPIDFMPKDLQTRTAGGVTYTLGDDGEYHKGGKP